jgi:hypothetical protein
LSASARRGGRGEDEENAEESQASAVTFEWCAGQDGLPLFEEVSSSSALVLFAPDAEEDYDGDDAEKQKHAHHEEREDEFGA